MENDGRYENSEIGKRSELLLRKSDFFYLQKFRNCALIMRWFVCMGERLTLQINKEITVCAELSDLLEVIRQRRFF